MTIPWAEIIAIVMELIQNCPEPEPEPGPEPVPTPERLLVFLHNPRPRQRLVIERRVRDAMGLDRAAWRQHGKAIMAEIYAEGRSATIEDARDLVDMAKAA